MEPLISIIIPIYNVEPYLRQCIDSVLAQTHQNLEIILVDDGSPDNCPAICDEYAEKDSRIRVIHKENGGLSDARNAGLDIANGDYIGFVDSDDWVAPDMFEYLLAGIIGYRAPVSCCNEISVYTYRMEFQSDRVDKVYTAADALNELFFDRLKNFAWNKLYRAELWNNLRFPVGQNFEDFLTIYKTFERAGRIAVLSEAKYYYRIRSGSISATKDFKNRFHLYKAIIDRYEEVAPRLPGYRPALFRLVRNWYIHELSFEVVTDPDRMELNLCLLDLLAPFVAKHKDEIATLLALGRLERKKFDAFAKGTVKGCKQALKYHNKMQKKQKRTQRIKRLLNLQ